MKTLVSGFNIRNKNMYGLSIAKNLLYVKIMMLMQFGNVQKTFLVQFKAILVLRLIGIEQLSNQAVFIPLIVNNTSMALQE